MAQHFDIPIAFDFKSQRMAWTPCSFSTIERKSLFPTKDHDVPHIPPPRIHLLTEPNPILIRLNSGLEHLSSTRPDAVLFETRSDEFNVCLEAIQNLKSSRKTLPESLTELLISFAEPTARERSADPWRMREEFMRLDETNAALRSFLERWGILDVETLDTAFVPPLDYTMVQSGGDKPMCVLPYLAWQRRARFRQSMLASPESWLKENAVLGFTHRRPRFPFIGITAKTCFRAIETTITLDHLRRVKSRVCARQDCDNVFSVDSNHGKIYCDQYCAHLVSVRRNRAAKKQAKPVKKRKVM